MDNLFFSFNVVAPLFVLMIAGYVTRLIKFVNDAFLAQLNKFVFQFCLPIMLFQDIRLSYAGDFSNTKLIFSAVIGITLVIILSFLIVPWVVKRKAQKGSIIQGIYRSNFLIYGLPLATGMYGQSAISSISMLMGIMIPFYNVAAVVILSIYSEKEQQQLSIKSIFKDIITNPLIIGCFFGLLGGMVHLEFPHFIELPLAQLAATASPLALFVMGGEFKFKSLRNNIYKVITVTFARLVLVPLAAVAVFINMGFRNVELSVLLTIFATPTAMASYIMAKNMHNDGELSGQVVVLTTACSCLTIFLFIYFLRTWGYL
jgi:predicted permease